jgi:hypothetical protein
VLAIERELRRLTEEIEKASCATSTTASRWRP